MRLGYFTMPMHPLHRPWAETLQEDRRDRHAGGQARLLRRLHRRASHRRQREHHQQPVVPRDADPETTNIKLATGTTNLSQSHPVLVATHAAMFDHLAKGRFILGISPGNLRTDAEAIGNLDEDRNKLFEEVIDVILEIWTRDPPYDIDLPNNRFKVSTAKTARLEIGLGMPRQALSEAVSGDRRHRGRALLEGRDRHGQARLPSAVGQLPAAEMGQDPLGELRAGQGRGRQDARHHRLAGRAHDLRLRGRQGRRALRAP